MPPRPAQTGTNGALSHLPTEPGPASHPPTVHPAPGPRALQGHQILRPADIARTIDRIAHQILERNGDQPVVLLGIPTRGVFLARRLGSRLGAFAARDVAVGALDITLYRDDLRLHPPRALEETRLPDGGISGAVVVLVDDVLYSGRTVRAALDALRDHGRPAVVQLAVLVDRGHRQLPIRADYVGKNIPTAFGDDVAVRLTEIDGLDSVDVTRAVGSGPDGEPLPATARTIHPRSERPS